MYLAATMDAIFTLDNITVNESGFNPRLAITIDAIINDLHVSLHVRMYMYMYIHFILLKLHMSAAIGEVMIMSLRAHTGSHPVSKMKCTV